MAYTEVVHNKAYEALLDKLRLNDIFEENLKVPVVAYRMRYLSKHANRVYPHDAKKQYLYSLILFTLFVENVSLFSQFYIVLWFNRFKNVLRDTAQQVQYTRNEETLHAQCGIKIINTIREEYPELFDVELEARISEEIKEALYSEVKLIDWIVGDYDQPNLNSDILVAYIHDRMADSMASIGFDFEYVPNEELKSKTIWMEEAMFGNNHADFFHRKPVEYSRNDKSYNVEDMFA